MAANTIVKLSWQFDDFVGSHSEIVGLVKMTLNNANFIIINQFLTSK
jgi:hypothetical protein